MQGLSLFPIIIQIFFTLFFYNLNILFHPKFVNLFYFLMKEVKILKCKFWVTDGTYFNASHKSASLLENIVKVICFLSLLDLLYEL